MAKSEAAVGVMKRFKTLMLRVWHEVSDDNVAGLAAQVGFFFVLALFPFFILLAALVGLLPSTQLWGQVLKWITLYLPQSSQTFVFNMVAGLTHGRESFLSLGVLSAAWAASGGVFTLMSSLNAAYEVPETRKLWKRALLAMLTLFVVCLLFLVSFGLLTVGHLFATWIAANVTPGLPLPELWRVGRWVASVVLLMVGMSYVYYLLPNHKAPLLWVTPGTILAVIVWIPASLGFNFYVRHIASYNKIYGALAGFMVLMVWIYMICLVVLVGAELNNEITKMRTAASTDSTADKLKQDLQVSRTERG
jgi:membrane protein